MKAYQELRRRGELTARINVRPPLAEVEHVAALGLSRGFGDDRLRLVGYKAWVDGILDALELADGSAFIETHAL